MDLPILAGIGEAEYVWIPICFKGLKAFSCRQGRGVWHTPHRRPGHGANDFVRYVPNGPFGPARGAYAIRPYSLPAGGVFSYGRLGWIEKPDGGRIAGIMDLPILADIGEAEYVWIPICFKELRTFSCRQGRGVLNTPYRRPGYGANDFVRYAPNGPFGPARGAYAIRPYNLPAGGVFSYG